MKKKTIFAIIAILTTCILNSQNKSKLIDLNETSKKHFKNQNFKKAITTSIELLKQAQLTLSDSWQFKAHNRLIYCYIRTNQMDSAYYHILKCESIIPNINKPVFKASFLVHKMKFFAVLGNKAITKLILNTNKNFLIETDKSLGTCYLSKLYHELSYLYFTNNEFDTSLIYLQKAKSTNNDIKDKIPLILLELSIYAETKELYKLRHLTDSLDILIKSEVEPSAKRYNFYYTYYNCLYAIYNNDFLNMQKQFSEINKQSKSGEFQLISLSKMFDLKSKYYAAIGNIDSAILFQSKYYEANISGIKEREVLKGDFIKFQLGLENKLGEEKLTSERLKRELLITKYFWWSCLSVFIALIIVIGIIVRYKVKIQFTKLKLNKLRAQINPHFISNTFNSIQNYILKNEPKKAIDFLNKYSKLVRESLYFSENDWITLDHEFDFIRNYIEMEQANLTKPLSVKLPKIEPTNKHVLIPSMLIQPLVENLIKHSFSQSNKNNYSINFNINNMTNKNIQLIITENSGVKYTPIRNNRISGKRIVEDRLLQFAKIFTNYIPNIQYQFSQTQNLIQMTIPIKIA